MKDLAALLKFVTNKGYSITIEPGYQGHGIRFVLSHPKMGNVYIDEWHDDAAMSRSLRGLFIEIPYEIGMQS